MTMDGNSHSAPVTTNQVTWEMVPMSGPALRQLESHHAIHDAAYGEAEEITMALRTAMTDGDNTRILHCAYVLVEHWETRTLRHAAAEEDGFYLEVLEHSPELADVITKLKRDHELMGILVDEVKHLLPKAGCTSAVFCRFEALLLLVAIHSREEEKYLLGKGRQ